VFGIIQIRPESSPNVFIHQIAKVKQFTRSDGVNSLKPTAIGTLNCE